MSEPMSSGEIEDVLSSIRRLVSEDLRPVALKSSAPDTTAPNPHAPEPSGKLLLTPAFRVVGGGAAPAPLVKMRPPEAEQAEAEAGGRDDGPYGEDAEAEFREIQDADLEMDGTVIEAEAHKTAGAEDWLPEDAPMDADHVLPDWEQPLPTSVPKSEAALELNRVVSEIGAAVVDDEDEWESETGDSPVATLSWKAPEWVEEAEVVADSVEAAEREAVARALADKAEAAAVAEIMARAAAAKAKAEAQEATKTADDSKAEPEADLFAEDEGYFDETVLRDLVRDLIREELSGTLGERITRNVRKLVRAEINRALTARDFD